MAFWEELHHAYQGHIKSVYLPLPGMKTGSGRPKQPDKYVIDFLNSRLFPVSILINALVLPQPVQDVYASMGPMLEQAISTWRITEITLTNIALAPLLKSDFPDLALAGSTLMEIDSPSQVMFLSDLDVLVPSTRITRNPDALYRLKQAFHGDIRLMVNEACLPSCPLRTQHFFEMTRPEIVFPRSLCEDFLVKYPWMRLTGSWVLPQHLHLFDGLYDQLKLSGRISLSNPSRYRHVLKHYVQRIPLLPHEIGGGPAGVCCPLDLDEMFYIKTLACDKNCMACTVCKDYWQEKTPRRLTGKTP